MRSRFLNRPASPADRHSRGRAEAALISGSFAIVLNTLLLKAADLVHLPTARGGLLRLLSMGITQVAHTFGTATLVLQLPTSGGFQIGFHLFVGILMAFFYAFVLEPRLAQPPLVKGVLYAAAVWLLNALVVLPATGEGFAGAAHLSAAGMAWYGTAHTVFFVLLATGYAALRRLRPTHTPDTEGHACAVRR